jgi:DNA-binding NtrC family response regulator
VNESVCLTGSSVSIRTLREDVEAAAGCDANVLITGEPGIGKNAVAQLIHLQSGRGREPLVTLDCAADPSCENFDRLDLARGGTILIDHVDAMNPETQERLMQFLETGRRALDVRVIAAAEGDLLEQVAAGGFREDLYYRLNVIHVVIAHRHDGDGEAVATTTAF